VCVVDDEWPAMLTPQNCEFGEVPKGDVNDAKVDSIFAVIYEIVACRQHAVCTMTRIVIKCSCHDDVLLAGSGR
jgi:hypothetical protein